MFEYTVMYSYLPVHIEAININSVDIISIFVCLIQFI